MPSRRENDGTLRTMGMDSIEAPETFEPVSDSATPTNGPSSSELIEKLNEAQQVAKIGSWDWDLESNAVWWSDETYRLFGVRPEDHVPTFDSSAQFIHPDDRDCYRRSFARAIQTGEPLDFELRIVAKDGATRYCKALGRCSYNPSGKPVRFVGTLMDVTDRKQAERAFEEESNRRRILFEQSPDGIVIIDPQTTRFLEFNTAAHAMLGYSRSEFAELSVIDLEALETAEEIRDRIRGALRSGKADFETRLRARPAQVRDIHVAAQVVDICGQKVYQCVWRDITDRKRAELSLQAANARLEQALARAEELAVRAEAANRAKSEFLANMSHEIRTPMTAILGFSELLGNSGLSWHEQHEFIEGIRTNGKALLKLIGDILDLSRIEAEKLTLAKTNCVLRQVVDDALAIVELQAERKDLAIKTDYEDPLPETVYTDPERLHQILVNLLGNAIKFTEEGGVCLTIRCAGDRLHPARMEFIVRDTGIGIPSDKVEELFQPFIQVDGSATRRYGGTGLGLCISKRLAVALGGDIEVASESGQGSVFTLTIDASPPSDEVSRTGFQPPAAAADLESSADGMRPSFRGRLLLAEDEPSLQRILVLLLQKMGLDVEVAGTGKMACEMAERSKANGVPYDLIFMDIQMPQMNGYEAVERLRRHGWERPIVALTAHAMAGDREKCLAAGCDDYVAKPIALADLRAVLEGYFTAK